MGEIRSLLIFNSNFWVVYWISSFHFKKVTDFKKISKNNRKIRKLVKSVIKKENVVKNTPRLQLLPKRSASLGRTRSDLSQQHSKAAPDTLDNDSFRELTTCIAINNVLAISLRPQEREILIPRYMEGSAFT